MGESAPRYLGLRHLQEEASTIQLEPQGLRVREGIKSSGRSYNRNVYQIQRAEDNAVAKFLATTLGLCYDDTKFGLVAVWLAVFR